MQEIFGLDLSISNSGWCKCNADSDRFEITGLGSIATIAKKEHTKGGEKIVDRVFPLQERIDMALNALVAQGLLNAYVRLIGLENYSFKSLGRSGTNLGELQGVIRHELWLNKTPWIVIAPQTLKAHVSKGGKISKGMSTMHTRLVYAEAILAWGKELENDDQADALALAELTWLFYRWNNQLPIAKVEMTKKLLDRLQKIKESFAE